MRGLADASFDLVIGNVPFGDVVLYDPVHNKGNHSIHNHFLIKSLALLKPGGLLVALTSRFTLDSQSDGARAEMHADGRPARRRATPGRRASPRRGHRRNHRPGRAPPPRRRAPSPASASWVNSAPVEIDGEQALLNRYFAEHPDHVAGTLTVASGPYARDLTVEGDISARPSAKRSSRVADTLAPAAGTVRPRAEAAAAGHDG